jgi:DNA-binding transcriptional ArsR family regulator
MRGDIDIASVAEVLADRSRCRMLLALGDGRALPASRLAAEAGIAASTSSGHLSRLVSAGMLAVEPHGRHRYYRLAGPHIADLLEAIMQVAPPLTVRSLREGTNAEALRRARTCYDHLAGRVGVAVMTALLDTGALTGGDGTFEASWSERDRLSSPGWDVAYEVTDAGRAVLRPRRGLLAGRPPAVRPLLRGLERAASSPGRRARRPAAAPLRGPGLGAAPGRLPRRERHRDRRQRTAPHPRTRRQRPGHGDQVNNPDH